MNIIILPLLQPAAADNIQKLRISNDFMDYANLIKQTIKLAGNHSIREQHYP